MTNAETRTLVFKNEAGDYFLLPQEMLEQGRVPAEQTAEVERFIAEQADEDVQGQSLWGSFVLVASAVGNTAADVYDFVHGSSSSSGSGGGPVVRDHRGNPGGWSPTR
ncbi:MAG: hypothetical protein ACRDJE_04505 [Dehalococcoidia bacterium]